MNLVFLGPPGSGKGTQAARLSAKLGLVHLSTGDMLREAVRNSTSLGRQAEEYMKRGDLVPDALIVGMIEAKLASGELKSGFILDGFPRNMPQAEALDQMFEKTKITLDAAVLLAVPDEELVRRLSGRWHCPQCQTGYNYPMSMPEVAGKCDKDGALLVRRPDDDEAVVRNRLDVYKKQTQPIVDYYRRKSLLKEVKADRKPDEVFESLLSMASSKASR
jgi:adenylate kinase